MPQRIITPDDPRHGKDSTYVNYKCRCDACKRAHASAHLKRKYGLTMQEKEAMVASQAGLCASCSDPLDGDLSRVHLDHDHTTQEPRSALCSGCNVAFGMLGESVRRISGLLDYASKHGVP